nr:uncharacterized protein LOC100184765 isoform X1 [Ciona intestinalis]|eukprot:XP_002126724.2 uncharacterized protein LOC100184765 isoform X1 [Ciona intestinalis]
MNILSILIVICFAGFTSQFNIPTIPLPVTNPCPKINTNGTLAFRNNCRTSMASVIAPLQANPSLNVIFVDICANGENLCFRDVDNSTTDCQFNSTNGWIECMCPANNDRFEELRPLSNTYVSGQFCKDINECTRNTDKCDPVGSSCNNTVGGHNCSCIFGYTGDGQTCNLYYDECTIPVEPVCSGNATCQNLDRMVPGCFNTSTLTTTTLMNATADKCIKLCQGKNATYAAIANANCSCSNTLPPVNTIMTCSITCMDGSNCGSSNGLASNVYITGSGHSCTCNSGYTGDGFTCTDIDECTGNPCNAVSENCTNTPGSYKCDCKPGYVRANETSCVLPIVHDCDNSETNRMQNRKEYWAGNNCSRVVLTPCDYNGSNPYADGERFTLSSLGSGACMGFRLHSAFDANILTMQSTYANLASINAVVKPVISCGTSKMRLSLDRYAVNAMGFDLSTLYLGGLGGISSSNPHKSNAACHGTRGYGIGAEYRFELGYGADCGNHRTTSVAGKLIFSNSVHGLIGSVSGSIDRTRTFRVDFTCTYNTQTKETTGSVIFIYNFGRKKRDILSPLINDPQISKLEADMTLWGDSQYTATYSSAQVLSVPSTIYTEVALKPSLPAKYSMQMVRCWATPSNNAYEPKYYNLLDNGCSLTSQSNSQSGIKVILNGESDKARIGFSTVSFKGGDSEMIFIRCLVNLCDRTKNSNCAKSCLDKANPTDGSVLHGDVYMKVLTAGPIVVRDICGGTSKGGCDHYCSVSIDKKPVCTCHEGFELGADKKSCSLKSKSSGQSYTVPWYYYVPAIIGGLFIIAVIVIYIRGKTEKGTYKLREDPEEEDGNERFLT